MHFPFRPLTTLNRLSVFEIFSVPPSLSWRLRFVSCLVDPHATFGCGCGDVKEADRSRRLVKKRSFFVIKTSLNRLPRLESPPRYPSRSGRGRRVRLDEITTLNRLSDMAVRWGPEMERMRESTIARTCVHGLQEDQSSRDRVVSIYFPGNINRRRREKKRRDGLCRCDYPAKRQGFIRRRRPERERYKLDAGRVAG